MAGVPLRKIPVKARTAWVSLRKNLQHLLGDDLRAIWAHGGTISVDEPPHGADLDTYVIVSRAPDEVTGRSIEDVQDVIARDGGVEWDAWYVLADDARGSDPPRHAFREGRRDTSWAIHRAHWLAGRYVNLHGPQPADIVQAPTWEELESELSRELEHIERHVAEGDTGPFEATYAILNGSRILYALETHSVAISKRAAGIWALQHLDSRWNAALQAAVRAYDGHADGHDVALLAAEMSPFVALARERLPSAEGRQANGLPRWSGS